MQISDDFRKSIVFIGRLGPKNEFVAAGTAFLVVVEDCSYLVTDQHIAFKLDDAPFYLRFNLLSGGSKVINFDPLEFATKWHVHPTDVDVDIAVMPINIDFIGSGLDVRLIAQSMFLQPNIITDGLVGIGDSCYTVGLFRLMAGNKRNLPVVHTGNIALLPSDERIPVRDWITDTGTRYFEGYLVESTNLRGLSGSPVFARPTYVLNLPTDDGMARLRVSSDHVVLLGVWMASWDAAPDEVLATDGGKDIRVPVGVGCVAPVEKLQEILSMTELQSLRKAELERRQLTCAASLDA